MLLFTSSYLFIYLFLKRTKHSIPKRYNDYFNGFSLTLFIGPHTILLLKNLYSKLCFQTPAKGSFPTCDWFTCHNILKKFAFIKHNTLNINIITIECLTQQNIVARLSVTKDLSMFFAFAVQELKRAGSMMNINLFWEDKGCDPQEIQES